MTINVARMLAKRLTHAIRFRVLANATTNYAKCEII